MLVAQYKTMANGIVTYIFIQLWSMHLRFMNRKIFTCLQYKRWQMSFLPATAWIIGYVWEPVHAAAATGVPLCVSLGVASVGRNEFVPGPQSSSHCDWWLRQSPL